MLPPRSHRYERDTTVALPVAATFDRLDDVAALASHMRERSVRMLGARLEFFPRSVARGRGARCGWQGRVLGLPISVEEEVMDYEPPRFKRWCTVGVPQLIVLARYCMRFELAEIPAGTGIRLCIEYTLPATGWRRLAGRLLGHTYARWCVDRMIQDLAANESAPAKAQRVTDDRNG